MVGNIYFDHPRNMPIVLAGILHVFAVQFWHGRFTAWSGLRSLIT